MGFGNFTGKKRYGDIIQLCRVVRKGEKLAGTRIIPLFVAEEIMQKAEAILAKGPIIKIVPLKEMRVGVVTTGSEVYSGLIEDAFGPVLIKKFGTLGSTVEKQAVKL